MLPDKDDIIAGLNIPGDPGGIRIVVAMSGGVDSSVTAGLLKHAGYDVVGVTLHLYDHGVATGRKGSCCSGQDINDARRVSEELGIPHYVLDYEQRFREAVIDTFVDSYTIGETPLPCVACNQTVKFHDLLKMARSIGARALATGHYAMLRHGIDGIELCCPGDPAHDQSYFLFATTLEQLDFLRFPLGIYNKEQTRAFANDMGLSVTKKPASQDICFVPTGHYSSIVKKLRPEAVHPGDIVHIDGRILGCHDGIVHFTVGQRRGIGVPSTEPLYVVRLDAARRQVIVGPRRALQTKHIWLRGVNWLGGDLAIEAKKGLSVLVRLRSSGEMCPATLYLTPDEARVDMYEENEGIACGQACVFYTVHKNIIRVLGGGWIDRTRCAHNSFVSGVCGGRIE